VRNDDPGKGSPLRCLAVLSLVAGGLALTVRWIRYGLTTQGYESWVSGAGHVDFTAPMRLGLLAIVIPVVAYGSLLVATLVLFRLRRPRVFLSYTSPDMDRATWLYSALRRRC